MRNRGVSSVVATILTVLITVAAVAVLWASVQPLLTNAAFVEDPHLRFTIDKKQSFTVYDPESGYLSVRVTRGADKDQPPVIALKFLLSIDGNTISRKTYNVVQPNHAQVYFFLIGFSANLESVKVVPIYLINGEEREGEIFTLETRIPFQPGALKDGVESFSVVPDADDPVSDGLILYYSFDAEYQDGSTVIDQSGQGHAGALAGDISFYERDDRAYASFDGDGDYIVVDSGQSLADATRNDKTIAFWAEFDCPLTIANSNQAPFGSYENYYVNLFDPCQTFASTAVRINYDLPPANPRSYLSEGIWNDLNGWEFYSVVFDQADGEIRLYRAGEQVDSLAGVVLDGSEPTSNFYVGTIGASDGVNPDPSFYLKGNLDDLRVYSRSLSNQEIQELYAYAS